MRDGKLAKSVKFVDTKDIGDPVEKAKEYYEDGLDELVFYDITASSDGRGIMLDVVERVAAQVFIPFSVGGGIRSVDDATALDSPAPKINVNSAAVKDPALIRRCSDAIGAQASSCRWTSGGRTRRRRSRPATKQLNGGRTPVGRDAVANARGRRARRGKW